MEEDAQGTEGTAEPVTPEEYADVVLKRITMEPQRSWDANVVEWETKSLGGTEFKALLADAIRAAVAEEREACAKLADESAHGHALTVRSQIARSSPGAVELMENVRNEAMRIAGEIRARGHAD